MGLIVSLTHPTDEFRIEMWLMRQSEDPKLFVVFLKPFLDGIYSAVQLKEASLGISLPLKSAGGLQAVMYKQNFAPFFGFFPSSCRLFPG